MASNSQPYCHLHKAGAGVGGYCIPVYPYFLMKIAEDHGLNLELTETGRKINEGMPKEVVRLIVEGTERLGLNKEMARVTLLGLAFRGDVPDSRLSPTYDIVKELLREGYNAITVHDPLIDDDERLAEIGAKLTNDLEEAVREADIVVIVTDHSAYKKLSVSKFRELVGKPVMLVDGRDILKIEACLGDSLYVGIGRPWTSI
jgi:nucleotide sugar dehydrogenase